MFGQFHRTGHKKTKQCWVYPVTVRLFITSGLSHGDSWRTIKIGFLSSAYINYQLSSPNELKDTSKWCTFYKHSYDTGTNTAERDHQQHWQLCLWSPTFYAKGRFSHIPSHMLQKLNSSAADVILIGYMQNTWIWCTTKVWHIFKCNEWRDAMQWNYFIIHIVFYFT